MKLVCTINGEKVEREADPCKRLLDFLRDDCGLTGVKEGCSEGECGEITTIEGLEKDGELDVLQKAFIENGAIQCGFCTPGMILSCKALLMEYPNPSDEQIKRAIEGNLCRCTGYEKIRTAVRAAVKEGVN